MITTGGNMENTRKEHILVCLSPSSTNERLVVSAAKMAEAFHGRFTALYIQPVSGKYMSHENEARLMKHIELARSLGAEIATVTGDDVPLLISEYAGVAGVTKIVVGRSGHERKFIFPKPKLTERLIQLAPDIDIYIMPDQNRPEVYRHSGSLISGQIFPSVSDLAIMIGILVLTTLLGICFQHLGFTEANIITVYILGVLLSSIATDSYLTGLIASVCSVILFNYLFTEPRMTLHAYGAGYPVTFAIMLVASVITGTLAGKLKQDSALLARDAFRNKILFDTDKLLEKAESEDEIIRIAGQQIARLLKRQVITVHAEDDDSGLLHTDDSDVVHDVRLSQKEKEIIHWVYKNHKRAGAGTDMFSEENRLYLAIRINERVYGVVGIDVTDRHFNSHENSIVLSILGECAFALDNERIRREKDEAAVVARNEKLRSSLLRTISHDLRTPLTSISGDAALLLERFHELDDNTVRRMLTDITDDSQWLVNVVENLLSVTRFEEGRISLHYSDQLVEDLISEAIRHVDRKKNEHVLKVRDEEDLILVHVDARLIMQVIINIVNNAIHYTPPGSLIEISAEKKEKMAVITVSDNGDGISDAMKPHIFEMFYTGEKSSDCSGRSLGLGLALCRSVIEAHGGTIQVEDNIPHGCVLRFTLPLSEAELYE